MGFLVWGLIGCAALVALCVAVVLVLWVLAYTGAGAIALVGSACRALSDWLKAAQAHSLHGGGQHG